MDIRDLIDEFVSRRRYKPYESICEDVLTSGKSYSLCSQEGYTESEYLQINIRSSVRGYTRNKDNAVELYKAFVSFLRERDVDAEVEFPPVAISSAFDRRIFIAKYLQSEGARLDALEDILWVSARTINEDLCSLREESAAIAIGGKRFFIPGMVRKNGTVQFESTAHPLFLTENLTQVIVMLRGLKTMSENSLFEPYAVLTAAEIWGQLSDYAKERIRFVLSEVIPDELAWYEALSARDVTRFVTETDSVRGGAHKMGFFLHCMKTGEKFCLEYDAGGSTEIYTDCSYVLGSLGADSAEVDTSLGRKKIELSKMLRTAYTVEELL